MQPDKSLSNLEKAKSNIVRGNVFLDSYPAQVHFLMIDKCNVKCIMCGGDYFRSKSGRMITLEKFMTMAANLKLENAREIVLAGAGDPLLNHDLVPIIHFVRNSYPHINISITTNGLALTPKLSGLLLNNGVSLVNVSINCATSGSYRRMMQVDGFDAVCQNAKSFIDQKKRGAGSTVLQFSAVINRLNIEELPLLIELARGIGVNSINLVYTRFYPEHKRHMNVENPADRLQNSDSLFFHQELSDHMVLNAKALARQHRIALTHEPLFSENAAPCKCTWPMNQIMVGFDGEIYPCGGAEVHFREKVEGGIYNFGNALQGPVDGFWNSEIYRLLRISSRQGDTCFVQECKCCANTISPNDIRSHIMQWDEVETANGRQRTAQSDGPELRCTVEEKPLVSVIVPTYNRPVQLRDTLKSIQAQTLKPVEIIVVNDCGIDVAKTIASLDQSRSINYIKHSKNKGLAASRNTGIRAARGRYIAYLDDDDIYYPDHLEALVKHLEASGGSVAYTDACRAFVTNEPDAPRITKRDVPYSFDFDRQRLLVSNYIPVLCFMHTRKAVEDAGGFDESLDSHEDWDLWVRMSRLHRFDHLRRVTCEFRWCTDGSTMTSARRADYLKTARRIYQKIRDSEAPGFDLVQKQESALVGRRYELHSMASKVMCSIIIPVHNKLDYTRKCIETLYRNTPASMIELIVVDNASTDGTAEFLQEIKQRKQIVSNGENMGFTIACNQGARVARGRHLVFLNNDTEPQKGWLEALVGLAEADLLVGAVGSKLVYPNGLLQEAGALIQPNGANRCVGHGDDPAKPQYNTDYEVDYCSAASLLVRHDLFREAGGFDERYAPAYYEDPDLCFALKEIGYKTVYASRSVVVHHESVTAGRGATGSIKRHYWINREKFQKKWGHYLTTKPPSHRPYKSPTARSGENGAGIAAPGADPEACTPRRFAAGGCPAPGTIDGAARAGGKRPLRIHVYRPGIDFELDPQLCYLLSPLLLDTPQENLCAVESDRSQWRFDTTFTRDWRGRPQLKNYRHDSSLYRTDGTPDDSDFFLFPYLLDEMIEREGIRKVSSWLQRLPHFLAHSRQHIFSTCHDSTERFGIDSVCFRASVARELRDAGAQSIPYPVDDFIEQTHFEVSRINYDASFVGFIGCPVSGSIRRQVISSLAKATRIRAFLSPSDRFHGHQRGSERQERRVLFLKSLTDSWTVVCPRGTGVNTYRFFETLSMGRIPVLLSDDCLLPFEDRIDYDAFILRIPEKDAGRTADIIADWLSTQTAETLLRRCRLARQTWEEYFACRRWNQRIVETLNKLQTPKTAPVVVDGVIFQLQHGKAFGISRLWRALLTELGKGELAPRILLLDRDGTAPEIPGITTRRIGGYRLGSAAEEAVALDAICREVQAGLFMSTYYTCTQATPSLLMLYDMIPERDQQAGPEASNPEWRDKYLAVTHASAFAAISHSTARDLERFYPQSDPRPREIIPCAVTADFREHTPEEIDAFRAASGLNKPYFILVGRRDPHKNQQLFFHAFARLSDRDRYAVVMAGSRRRLDAEWQALLGGADAVAGFFSDEQLSLLYSGALALVYPSVYEGFGLPILEAMQSGCPVITCHNSSIFEVAGGAALYVGEGDAGHLARTLLDVQQPDVRGYLVQSGLEQARRFSWKKSAELLTVAIDARL